MSVFAPISAPVLRSVDPVEVARFLKERERYELEITAKTFEVPSLKPLLYSASIDRSPLKNLFFMGKFDSIASEVTDVSRLQDSHIRTYIESIVSRSSESPMDPAVIERALDGWCMPTHILNADARVTHFCSEFFDRLETVGCGYFREENPKKCVNLLIQRLQPAVLKREIRKRVSYDEGLEKDLKKFISALSREAINCQVYGADTKAPSTKPGPSMSTSNKSKSRGTNRDNEAPKSEGKTKKLPLCLWEEHSAKGIRHYLRDCKECPKETKDKLFDEHRSKKGNGAKRTTDAHDTTSKSVIFNATFGGHYRSTICADNCSDDNILDTHMLSEFKRSGVDHVTENLPRPRHFDMAASLPDGRPASLICHKIVTVDTELHIRHGSALVLRGVRWLITDQAVGEPLFDRY